MAVKISPDGKTIVSVSADGAILRWSFPEELLMSDSGEMEVEPDATTVPQE